MSRDDGKMDPPDCDTHEGLVKRVKELEAAIQHMSDYTHHTKYLEYDLIPTTKRLTFDIIRQGTITINDVDDDEYYKFVASNGYEIISRSRMDIQTERLWLLGSTNDGSGERSGSMVFSSNKKRDIAMKEFIKAIEEWNEHIDNGMEGLRWLR